MHYRAHERAGFRLVSKKRGELQVNVARRKRRCERGHYLLGSGAVDRPRFFIGNAVKTGARTNSKPCPLHLHAYVVKGLLSLQTLEGRLLRYVAKQVVAFL